MSVFYIERRDAPLRSIEVGPNWTSLTGRAPRPERLFDVVAVEGRGEWQIARDAAIEARRPYALTIEIADDMGKRHMFLDRGSPIVGRTAR